MTVSSQANNATFVGNGVTTAFPLPFRFFSNSHIFAYFIDPASGASTPMAIGVDYTLTGAGEPEVDGNAVSVLTTTVPLANLRGLYVERVMPQVQETDIVNQGEFFASTHEDVFDRLTMLIQQANENSAGAIRVAIGDPEPNRLPPALQRAGLLMSFDNLGNPIASFPASDSATDLAMRLANQVDPAKGTTLIGHYGRTLREKLDSLAFCPEDFGAVGDGVTDDTAAFNLLEAALIANGGGYVVIDRSFNIPAGLDWTIGNLTLDGLGIGEIKSSGVPNNALYLHDANNLEVRDLRVTVPRANLRSGGFCVLFANATNVVSRGVRTDGGTVGIWHYNCHDVSVTDCYIDTPKADGIHFGQGSSRCTASGNTVVNSGDDAFSTTYYTGFARPTDIVFADNIVRGTIWGAGVAVYSADRVVVSGNNISNTALYGVVTTTHDGGGQPTDCTVEGNQIHGACQAEKQPDSYWFGTDPGLDLAVTSELHKSAIVVEGTDVSVKNNSVSAVTSLPNGLRRRGLMLNGTARAAITGNTFNDVNGDGISTTASANTQLVINNNTFESVLGVAIRCTSPAGASLSICNNVGGYGAILSGEPYLVYLQNAGSVLAIIDNNTSAGGRGIFYDGSSTNVAAANNSAGPAYWDAITPGVSSSAGAITTASASGYVRTEGKTLFYKIRALITTNGTGSGELQITGLPLAKSGQLIAHGCGRESALTGKMLLSSMGGSIGGGGTTLIVRSYDNAYPGANGAVLEVTGFYEIA